MPLLGHHTFVHVVDQCFETFPIYLDGVAHQRAERQRRMQYSDRQELPPLPVGQAAVMRTIVDRMNKWKEMRVVEPVSTHSYLVEAGGEILGRNVEGRQHSL